MREKMRDRSVDFLLKHAGPVIQYRLRKEIFNQISPDESRKFLCQIAELPNFKLLQGYVKPSGYIGSGMHSWDHWRGQVLHETPLQDGEAAARLLSYYAIPKDHPLVQNFVKAMRDEETLRKEFSYIPPDLKSFLLTLPVCSAGVEFRGWLGRPSSESAQSLVDSGTLH